MQWQEVPCCKMLLTPYVILFIVTILHITLPIKSDQSPSVAELNPGYYAFPTTNRRIGSPPKVKPPPYLPTDIPCPGTVLLLSSLSLSLSLSPSLLLNDPPLPPFNVSL